MTDAELKPLCSCHSCNARRVDAVEAQDWWHEAPLEDPHAGIGLLRMALWCLILIPLHQAWTNFRNWRKN